MAGHAALTAAWRHAAPASCAAWARPLCNSAAAPPRRRVRKPLPAPRSRPDYHERVAAIQAAVPEYRSAADAIDLRPSLFTLKPDVLASRVVALRELLPAADVCKMLNRAPQLLTFREETLRSNMEYYKTMLQGCDVQAMAICHPVLIYHKPEPVEKRMHRYADLFPLTDVKWLFSRVPQFATLETEIVQKKIATLRELIPGIDVEHVVVKRHPRILLMNMDIVRHRIEVLRKAFPPHVDIAKLALRYPGTLISRTEHLEEKITALREACAPIPEYMHELETKQGPFQVATQRKVARVRGWIGVVAELKQRRPTMKLPRVEHLLQCSAETFRERFGKEWELEFGTELDDFA